MIPAILMISSSIGLDVAANQPFNTIGFWRIISLTGLGFLIGLLFVLFLEYVVQFASKKRHHLPADRIGLLLSYLGFVCVVWSDIYERFQNNTPATWKIYGCGAFLALGLISLIRKIYRVHHLADEDKLLEAGL